jgi:hypothetical protein
MSGHKYTSKYTGEAWHGPVDHECDKCHGTQSVEQLTIVRRNVIVERLDRYECLDCIRRDMAERQIARKAELDAMPRCEVPTCKRRGIYQVGHYDKVLLCGRHLTKARATNEQQNAPLGFLAMFGTAISGKQILKLLEEGAN